MTARNGNGNGQSWIWPSVIAGAFALVNAFWVVVWGTITTETSRLQREIDRLYTRAEEVYTKKENTEQYRQRISIEIKNNQLLIENLVTQLRRVRDDVITKDSYQGRHDAIIEDIKRSNIRIDELRRDFGASYTLSDKIKELQEQIKLLQLQGFQKQGSSKATAP